MSGNGQVLQERLFEWGRRPVAIDLFAGAGGLSLGFEQAGFDVAAAVEYDPIHAAVHKINFPHTQVICGDVQHLTAAEIRERAGLGKRQIDVVFGGPPCQGFSLIGHRVLEDPRNSLVFHFLRIVTELKPRTFVMENVPGMATGAHTGLLEELVRGFREAGYRVRLPYKILNAADYGVPQNRRRVILLGARNGTLLPDYPQPSTRRRDAKGRSSASDSETSLLSQGDLLYLTLPECPSVGDAIGDLPDIERFERLRKTDVLKGARLGEGSLYARILRGEVADLEDFSYPRSRPKGELTGCLRAEHAEESRRRFAATEPGTTEPISRFYRLPWDGLCNTLRSGTASDRGAFTSPRPIHPVYARCISVREAARLHSYPDWFRFHRTIWHGFRQIGNSVPPLLGRAVGAMVMRSLEDEPVRLDQTIVLDGEALAGFDMRQAADYFGVRRDVIAPRRRLVEKTGR